MFQAPQQGTVFSKAQLAEIGRGVKLKPKIKTADPIVDLILRADRAWIEYVEAYNKARSIAARLPEKDRRQYPYIPLSELLPTAPDWLLRSFAYAPEFGFEGHIEKEFKKKLKSWRGNIKSGRRVIREWKVDAKNNQERFGKFIRERKEINAERQLWIDNLPRYLKPAQQALRKELRRRKAAQQKAGLTAAWHREWRARTELWKLNEETVATRPRSIEGALAAITFAEQRMQEGDTIAFFQNAADGSLDGLGKLLRASVALIHREAVPHFKIVRGIYEQQPRKR